MSGHDRRLHAPLSPDHVTRDTRLMIADHGWAPPFLAVKVP